MTTIEDFTHEQLINELLRRGNRGELRIDSFWMEDVLHIEIGRLNIGDIVTDETEAESD